MLPFPIYLCKAADELNCSEISITPIFNGTDCFCWIFLSLYNCSRSHVLPRRQPCTDPLKHIQQKLPEGTAQAGTQPKDTSREECHKPNAKCLISAVSLHDNCDHCPSATHSYSWGWVWLPPGHPETAQVGTSNSHTARNSFAPHTTRYPSASKRWVTATRLPRSSKHTGKVRKQQVR